MPSLQADLSPSTRAELKHPLSLAGFGAEAFGSTWKCPPHIKLMCDTLMDFIFGDMNRLMIMCGPRHGKSETCSHLLPPFYLGSFPDDRVIHAAYDSGFAERWGRQSKELFQAHGPRIFGKTVNPMKEANSDWEVLGSKDGGMLSVGLGAGITGRGANLFIIDDPIKTPEEAFSEAYREKLWDIYISVVTYRMEPGGKILLLYTPWHEDDLGQRILRMAADGDMEPWNVLRMPAIAETQEERDEWAADFKLPIGLPDPIGRQPGEALWPERYSIEDLRKKQKPDPEHFESLFQGRPRRRQGSVFQSQWFLDRETGRNQYVACVPQDQGPVERCRFWDRAASTKKKSDYSVGALVAKVGSRYYIEDIVEGQWSPGERDRIIVQTAHSDRAMHGEVWIRGEQEPAASGVDAAQAFITMLDGFPVDCKIASGDKEVRAYALASQSQVGNVYIVRAPWNKRLMQQFTSFPKGKNDDIVDAVSGAYNKMAGTQATYLRVRSPTSGWYGRKVS